ncbi:hypothetical protein GH5_08032 [Leishmania sp. Ghana 2012 LV757]|uniref:hypothetical protein n=1 Tax=Leishmania sp. Ghana 2012 LV757 TaxID=2803181 RepID=UPI001B743187|nr:hypothetical protein GH5_08032 [Leishmania sp. Ghana 2012 LV757]
MSYFAEHLVNMPWGYSEGIIEAFKTISRSLVEGDEYVLLLLIFLGIPAALIMWSISRSIDRAHSRVRYASAYRDEDGTDYATSSSGSSASRSSSDGEAAYRAHRRSGLRPTMDEVVQAAQQLTGQETACRRRRQRLTARYGRVEDGPSQAARDGETEGKED